MQLLKKILQHFEIVALLLELRIIGLQLNLKYVV